MFAGVLVSTLLALVWLRVGVLQHVLVIVSAVLEELGTKRALPVNPFLAAAQKQHVTFRMSSLRATQDVNIAY